MNKVAKNKKQWLDTTNAPKITTANELKEVPPYFLKSNIKKEEFDKQGRVITSYETKTTDIFGKINETAKLLKQTEMQKVLEQIKELEEGL